MACLIASGSLEFLIDSSVIIDLGFMFGELEVGIDICGVCIFCGGTATDSMPDFSSKPGHRS